MEQIRELAHNRAWELEWETTRNRALEARMEEMAGLLETILARLDLEAAERGEDAVFPCSALRDDIRAVLARVRGEE